MVDEVPELSLPTFSERDCALLAKFPADKPKFDAIEPEEGDQLRDIRIRLRTLAEIGADRYGGKVRMARSVSALNPNGRVPRSYWSCFFPKPQKKFKTNKSYNLQLVLTILPTGVELLFCLGTGQSQEKSHEAIERNDKQLRMVRSALAKLPTSTLRRVEQSLSPEWYLRKRWMMAPPAQDFEDLTQWRDHAASNQGAGASISRYFALDYVKERGDEIAAHFLEASSLFQPIFEEVYASIAEVLKREEAQEPPKPTPSSTKAPPRRVRKVALAEPPPRLDLLAIHADLSAALRESDLVFGTTHDELVRAFLASLAARPFLILTGLSGSGKTQIALRFGEWLGGDRGLVIPVRPDWTGAEALFGYEDALQPIKRGKRAWNVPQALEFMLRAASDPRNPHVLILDEMNLAHVERYFADFLSGMETRKPCLPNLVKGNDGCWRLAPGKEVRIPLPSNLFVVGTVNADETTYAFSPKVLDRANSIEFRVRTEDLQASYRRPRPCRAGPSDLVRGFLAIAADDDWHVRNPPAGSAVFSAGMEGVHRILAKDNLEFGKRVFHDATRFAAMLSAAGDADPHRALDRQVMQKVLPRIHGSRARTESPLCALAFACFDTDETLSGAEGRRRFDPLGDEPGPLRLPLSIDKIRGMVRRLRANQFTSFTE